jgi:hypothetical protein
LKAFDESANEERRACLADSFVLGVKGEVLTEADFL